MVALPVVVLVDPISTGKLLVDIVLSRGFGVLALWSKERAESLSGIHKGVYKAVEEQVSIPDTVKAIKDALSSAIVACIPGSESGVNLADLISIELGLLANGSGNRPFPAGDRRNKHVQGRALKGIAGCRAIREVCGCSWEEVKDSCRELGLPMVVKPVQSGGTDGVKLCHSMQAVEEHFSHLQATKRQFASSDHAILLQAFLVGQEYVVDHVSRDGVHKTAMIWVYEKQPTNGSDFVYLATRPVETKECPSDLIPYTRSVLDALDIQNGATHAEVMMTADGPCLIEVNVRIMGANGSYISLARLLTGTSHADAVLDCIDQKRFDALPDVPRAFQASGLVVALISYSSGIVASTPGYERMKKMASFLELHTSISPGSAVEVTVDAFTCAGILVLAGSKDQIRADVVEDGKSTSKILRSKGSLTHRSEASIPMAASHTAMLLQGMAQLHSPRSASTTLVRHPNQTFVQYVEMLGDVWKHLCSDLRERLMQDPSVEPRRSTAEENAPDRTGSIQLVSFPTRKNSPGRCSLSRVEVVSKRRPQVMPLPSTPPSGPTRAPLLPRFCELEETDDWHECQDQDLPHSDSFSRNTSTFSTQSTPMTTGRAMVSGSASPVGSGPSQLVRSWDCTSGYRTPDRPRGFIRCFERKDPTEQVIKRRQSTSSIDKLSHEALLAPARELRRMSLAPPVDAEKAQKELEETKNLLEKCMSDLADQKMYDQMLEKFRPFLTALSRAEQLLRREQPETLLGFLEPKGRILTFLLELHQQKRQYRRQTHCSLNVLLQCDSWLEVYHREGLLARTPQELSSSRNGFPMAQLLLALPMLQRRRVSKIPEPEVLKVVAEVVAEAPLVISPTRRAAVEADAKVMREKRLRRATRRPEESLDDLLIRSRDQAEALDYAAGGDSDEVQVAFETFHRAVRQAFEKKAAAKGRLSLEGFEPKPQLGQIRKLQC
eukprot:s5089_g1.t1